MMAAVDSHPPCFLPLGITTWIHQPKLIHTEIGAEPGNTAHVQRACWFNQDDDDQSVQLMEMTQEIRHGLGSHLKAWHGGGFATHNLVNQIGISHSLADPSQLGGQQSLPCQAMTSSAIDPEQLATVIRIPLQFQGCFDVRVLLGTVDHPEQQHNAGQRRQKNECCNQASTSIVWICCS